MNLNNFMQYIYNSLLKQNYRNCFPNKSLLPENCSHGYKVNVSSTVLQNTAVRNIIGLSILSRNDVLVVNVFSEIQRAGQFSVCSLKLQELLKIMFFRNTKFKVAVEVLSGCNFSAPGAQVIVIKNNLI